MESQNFKINQRDLDFSIVIPLLNEAESLMELHQRIQKVFLQELSDKTFEIIFVDDGSTDDSWSIIQELNAQNPEVKAIKFKKNFGKAQALNAAFQKANGEIVVTMDADLQDFPEEIPHLYQALKNNDWDMVSGWKQKRQDPVLTKNLPSKLFNLVAQKTSGLPLHDFNCGLKAYKKSLVKNINLRSDMHRYIPVIAKNLGFSKIGEIRVQHTARKHGSSKFGNSRFINGFLDLITLWFVNQFGHRPMHFFGAAGLLMFILGFLTSAFIGLKKLYLLYQEIPAKLVTTDAWFYIALTCMIIGSQLFLAGFLGEIFVRNRVDKKDFQIEIELD
ncbi:Undecaprenyl-phosphate 4-deoxy-4-formamido-L-arabinose transferase [Candidatus Ornithobacterium hominis]|nr:Undecaprenyl-phosphate 4-deoxy-4-formamido-L-arabinose transferase [Candidatus Ornithobacterium hominis]